MSAVPVMKASLKGLKLVGLSISLSEAIVNGLPSDCKRCFFSRSKHLLYFFWVVYLTPLVWW